VGAEGFLGGGAGAGAWLVGGGAGLCDTGAVLTLCHRSRTEEVMGAKEAVNSSLLGTEFATWLMESCVCVMRSLWVSTLSRREASALIVEQRRGRIMDSPVERSLPSSELVGRGTTSLKPSLLSVSPRKFLT